MGDPSGLALPATDADALRRVLAAPEALAPLSGIEFAWFDTRESAAGAMARLVAADVLALREARDDNPSEFIGFTQEGIAMAGYVGLLKEQPMLRKIWKRAAFSSRLQRQMQAERPDQPLAVRWALRLRRSDEGSERALSGWTVLDALDAMGDDNPVVGLGEIQRALATQGDIDVTHTVVADVVTQMTEQGALERVDEGWRPVLARTVGERTLKRLVAGRPEPAGDHYPDVRKEGRPSRGSR